ncbi:MAG: PD40 domain-containing protein [Planctomycetes bacterium]|nr:PD40 domain-containing protein [Planctomycetota bacterium]
MTRVTVTGRGTSHAGAVMGSRAAPLIIVLFVLALGVLSPSRPAGAGPRGEPPRSVREALERGSALGFDRVLFVKRHPGRFPHMCDQYYGSFARPGGGLFVLEDVWGEPRAADLLGGRLPEGSFLSPELSPDGARVLFAYARERKDAGQGAIWTPEVCFHVYRVNIDGTGLEQLTDGPHDDFDPCWLSDGRIAFISTRRGGFCRCGDRPVPAYTLHVMEADGSGIRRISHHETNEWHPALLADGRLVYTRWDYVDRHTNLAHSLWVTGPDGSGPAALFGNYNFDRRPWGEWCPRPIPGSSKLVAVAGAHHGYAIGSLILVDPVKGSDGSRPVTRLTPDVPFPEAEGWPQSAYTTPYPLGESVFLAAHSPSWSTRDAAHSVTMGLCLIDASGSRVLLYRDPEISSLDPIPVLPRPAPGTWVPEARAVAGGEGELLLLDVYRSTEPIPRGSIRELRVIQILPKSTYRNDHPKVSAAKQVSARWLVGTAPVEEDGSAYFRAPAGVPLLFQAVDSDGLAYQGMRTVTYLQPGERRACIGCHEPRNTAPPAAAPLAARRPPSALVPGPEGSRPFSYAKLVQPVLDRLCVSCHGEREPAGGVRLTGDFTAASGPHTESYRSLARKSLVTWFDSINGSEWLPRTYPGELGARKSRLIDLLRRGHEGVVLERADLERLALWIDLNVPFYGAYEEAHVAAQREGREVREEEILQ